MLADKDKNLLDCSLVSLRAFREAARHENFTLAAAQMSVTQSAISHHIKTLERQLNIKLFERRGRKLVLTNEGRVLHQSVEEAFTRLAQTIANISAGNVRRRVVLGVLSSFATKWLVPRLGNFYRAEPDIELVVRSVNHTIDVERENVDLAVTTLPAPPASSNTKSTLMWREHLFAVCSPAYASELEKSIDQLNGKTLLHDETEIAAERGFDWQSWLRHFGIENIMPNCASQYFSQSDLTLQSAIAGNGIALTRTSIAATDIKNGLLVNPFPHHDIATHTACYLCGLHSSWNKDGNRQLRKWLLAEATADITPHHRKGKRKQCAKASA